MKPTTLYKKAIAKWGNSLQVLMAIEEMAELTKELIKFFRGRTEHYKIAEEMADVEIMLEQLKIMFKNHLLVRIKKENKLKRLDEILRKET